MMDCFTYAWLEQDAFDIRALDEDNYFQLGLTMDQVIGQRYPLPKKQSLRLRLGGTVIHLTTNFYQGSFTPFKQIEKTGLWNDDRIFGVFRSKNYEMVAIVFPVHGPGTVVVNAIQWTGGVILFNNAVEGSLLATLPYYPRKTVWDYLVLMLQRLDDNSPVATYYKSKQVKIIVQTQCVNEQMWSEPCELLWGKKMKKGQDENHEEKLTLENATENKAEKIGASAKPKKAQKSAASTKPKKSNKIAASSSEKKSEKKKAMKRPSSKK